MNRRDATWWPLGDQQAGGERCLRVRQGREGGRGESGRRWAAILEREGQLVVGQEETSRPLSLPESAKYVRLHP